MKHLDYPLHFDVRRRTAVTDTDDHVRDLIEQVLFTSPGERVNRPEFGSGVRQLLFAPLTDELAATTQFLVQSALQQWLGDILEVEGVQVTTQDSALTVTVQFTVRRTRQTKVAQFTREA